MLLPDWSSLDAVSRFVSRLGISEWSCLAVAAVTEVTALFLERMKRLQQALEIIGAVAFLAFIPILHFEHVYSDRAAQLLSGNIQSEKTQVSQLTKRLAESGAQVTTARQEAAQASADSRVDRQRLEASENQILDLERKRRPRTLTTQQRDHIVSALLPYSGRASAAIRVLSLESEAQNFANQLASALRDSGWTVTTNMAELTSRQAIFGLKVDVGDVQNPPIGANALVKALRDAGISVDTGLDTDGGPNGLFLFVGSKP